MKAAYSPKQTKGFYHWDALKEFLQDKGIVASKLMCYQELQEMRTVNNALRHSGTLDNNIPSIQEFTDIDYWSSAHRLAFCKRVQDGPKRFLEDLSNHIYKERYYFDETKLQEMATEMALRMDKKNALRLYELVEVNSL